MRRSSAGRDGYALILVMVFIVLLLAFLMVAYRSIASAVRIESVRTTQVACDEGSIHAMAKAMALLETGLPPSTLYICAVTIATPAGPRPYTVTYTLEGGTTWSVHAAATSPDETPPLMPTTFATLP
jgi:hypothetical protein